MGGVVAVGGVSVLGTAVSTTPSFSATTTGVAVTSTIGSLPRSVVALSGLFVSKITAPTTTNKARIPAAQRHRRGKLLPEACEGSGIGASAVGFAASGCPLITLATCANISCACCVILVATASMSREVSTQRLRHACSIVIVRGSTLTMP